MIAALNVIVAHADGVRNVLTLSVIGAPDAAKEVFDPADNL
jgi:hypothetical protein